MVCAILVNGEDRSSEEHPQQARRRHLEVFVLDYGVKVRSSVRSCSRRVAVCCVLVFIRTQTQLWIVLVAPVMGQRIHVEQGPPRQVKSGGEVQCGMTHDLIESDVDADRQMKPKPGTTQVPTGSDWETISALARHGGVVRHELDHRVSRPVKPGSRVKTKEEQALAMDERPEIRERR